MWQEKPWRRWAPRLFCVPGFREQKGEEMKELERMNGWSPELDRSVPLEQELNTETAEETASRAESGGLGAVRRPGRELEPVELLAMAVVEKAVEDWRSAVEKLRLWPEDPAAGWILRETERFFRSRWFRILVDLDGEEFLSRLRRQAGRLPASSASCAQARRLGRLKSRRNRQKRA